jgi:ribosome-binding factor A
MPKQIREPSIRQRKINSLLKQRIASIIRGGDFAGLRGMVTVQSVAVTPDLREAKVWFSCVGQSLDEAQKILERHVYEIQGQLYRGATMRIVPRIRFLIDPGPETADQLARVFNKIHE